MDLGRDIMRLLVFSDIHGNSQALYALLRMMSELEYDTVAFLGDIFGYYYEQEECLRLLKEIPDLIWLKGNHDKYAIDAYCDNADSELLVKLYGHSYSNLKSRFMTDEISFLESKPYACTLKVDGKQVGMFHGRPGDPVEGRIYEDTELPETEFSPYDYVLIGHTHCKIDKKIGNTRIISPGSLGQPRDCRGYGFALLDVESDNCEFINVEVDNGELKKQIDINDKDLAKLYDVISREM